MFFFPLFTPARVKPLLRMRLAAWRCTKCETETHATFHMHATPQCTYARMHAYMRVNRTPSQRCHLRQGYPRLGHRMLRRSVPDPPTSRSDLRQADLTSSRIHTSHFVRGERDL